MNLSRRTFVGGLIAAVSAPAIVQAQSLMPVKVLKPCGPLIVHVDRVIHFGRKTFPTIQDAVDYIAAMGSGRSEMVSVRGAAVAMPRGEHSLVVDCNLSVVINGTFYSHNARSTALIARNGGSVIGSRIISESGL